MPSRENLVLLALLAAGLNIGAYAASPEGSAIVRSSESIEAPTYNGFRRYHASCNHCHGPDGMGSTVAPSLIDRLPPFERFRGVVLDGIVEGRSVMKGFAGDPNVLPYLDDIYAYLRARADGRLGRGRPGRPDR